MFRYSGQGFVPARITAKPIEDLGTITFLGTEVVEKHPVLKDWNMATPADPWTRMPKKRASTAWRGGLRVESFYPIVQGYKDTQAVGMRFNFSDPLELNRLTLAGSYSPNGDIDDSERVHLRADYERYDWKLRALYNNADFYDLFGPDQDGPQGLRLRRRAQAEPRLRRTEEARPDVRRQLLGQPRPAARATRTSRWTVDGSRRSTRA